MIWMFIHNSNHLECGGFVVLLPPLYLTLVAGALLPLSGSFFTPFSASSNTRAVQPEPDMDEKLKSYANASDTSSNIPSPVMVYSVVFAIISATIHKHLSSYLVR